MLPGLKNLFLQIILKDLHFIREHAPAKINIAAGEYGYNLPYFEAMLYAEAVDVLQADATRCGGITGFYKSRIFMRSTSTALLFTLCACIAFASPLCLSPSFYIAEYFHDHVRIENICLMVCSL